MANIDKNAPRREAKREDTKPGEPKKAEPASDLHAEPRTNDPHSKRDGSEQERKLLDASNANRSDTSSDSVRSLSSPPGEPYNDIRLRKEESDRAPHRS